MSGSTVSPIMLFCHIFDDRVDDYDDGDDDDDDDKLLFVVLFHGRSIIGPEI